MMKRNTPSIFIWLLFAGMFCSPCEKVAAQGKDGSLDTLLTAMDSLALNQPVEKVYLHTDKPYYAAGDTIWLKAYVVQGIQNWPSTLSGAVYADLIDETDSIVGALKLPLINGLGKGNFVLNAKLAEGNYRLRAYTQWMRNAGEDFFYDEFIPIGNTGSERVAAAAGLETDDKDHRRFVRLEYRDAETGRPMVGKDVGYVLRMGQRNYQGKGQTDEAGNLLLDVTGKDSRIDRYSVQTLLYDGRMNSKHRFVINKVPDSCDVAFFPEGGTLVAGLTNRVAVKVTGPNGVGLAATGELLDPDGKIVAEWQTLHRGMGLLTFVPQAGMLYKAHLRLEDGSDADYAFPEVRPEGYVLSVFPNLKADSLLVRVQRSKGHLSGAIHMLVQHNGEVLVKKSLDFSRPVMQSFMPNTLFPGGVSQFTLLDDAGRPLAERIAFIYRPDSLDIQTEAVAGHRIRDSARIDLRIKGGADQKLEWANLSVAVTDEGKVPVAGGGEGNIFAQLLLRSDVRGYIEDPGFYFTEVNPEKKDKLDLLLMTQGYRQYQWKELAVGKLPAVRYAAEPLIQSVSGQLVNLRGKAIKDGQIVLFSNKLGTHLDSKTDENGFFSFDNLLMEEGLSFSLQGRNARGGDRVEIKLNEVPRLSVTKSLAGNVPAPLNASFQAFIRQRRKDDQAFHFNGEQNLLDEVEVVARPRTHLIIRGVSVPMGEIDYVIHPKASDGDKNLLECLRRWVPGLRVGTLGPSGGSAGSSIRPIGGMKDNYLTSAAMSVTRGGWSAGNGGAPDVPVPRLISNGREMQLLYNGFNLSSNPDDAMRIRDFLMDEESFDPDNIVAVYVKEYTGTGLDGLRSFLYVQTKDGLMWPPFLNWNNVLYKPQGYSLVKEFYSPRYDRGALEAMEADRRSTIYWNPDLRPDDEGRASFGYFNAATPGTYRVVVEGIGSDGRLGRKVFRYAVNDADEGQ